MPGAASTKACTEINRNKSWNQQVLTDRTIPNSKPDILTRDNGNGTWMLTDVKIAGDRNVIKREGQMTVQYIEITVKKYSACGLYNRSDTSSVTGALGDI